MSDGPPGGDAALTVSLRDVPVGTLRRFGNLTTFELLDDYLNRPARPVLGQVFEEQPRGRWQQSQRLPAWFANLLPEEPWRSVIARGHGVSPRSEYRLLSLLADDLPGAVTLQPVDPERLLLGERVPMAAGDAATGSDFPVRLSLAGVQPKLSVVWSSNTLTLPGRGRFGDWILKFPSARFPGVPENEYAMMRWAARAGIDVPTVDLRPQELLGELPPSLDRLRGSVVYLVKRFDRSPDGLGRIHMEDLSQVIGGWPEDKYRGASYEKVALIVRVLTGSADYLEFIRRLVFCVAIGNEDAHLKNWSLWYPDAINARLSPAYDLVSTVQYDELDRGLALRLRDTHRMDGIDRETFTRLARKAGADAGATLSVVDDTLDRMRTSWAEVVDECGIERSFRERLARHHAGIPLLASLRDR